jgi:hypothetical protein
VAEFGKSKRIREIFGCEDDTIKMNRTNRMRISYNEKIFFNPPTQVKNAKNENIQLTSLINNVITTTSTRSSHRSKDSTIKFNVNINNNYYNSNYNYVINTEGEKKTDKEDSGITGFFSK